MKRDFFDYMYQVMLANEQVYLIFIGLGFPRLDEFRKAFGDRAINTEASEQTALDIAVGLAYAGKIPFTYTITTFYLRAMETLRTYIDHECLPVKMIGAGVGDEYSEMDGFSHEAGDVPFILSTLPNITQYHPSTTDAMKAMIDLTLQSKNPAFINIHK